MKEMLEEASNDDDQESNLMEDDKALVLEAKREAHF